MAWRNPDEKTEILTDNEVVSLLKTEVSKTTLTAYAVSIDSTPQYVSDVCNLRRKPGTKILTSLGLQREITYKRRWR